MFSYFQGIRPSGRRGPSSHTTSSRRIHESTQNSGTSYNAQSLHEKVEADNFKFPTATPNQAPVLPPIPRIASQYSPPEKPFCEESEGEVEQLIARPSISSQVSGGALDNNDILHSEQEKESKGNGNKGMLHSKGTRPNVHAHYNHAPREVEEAYEMEGLINRPYTESRPYRTQSPQQKPLEEIPDNSKEEVMHHTASYVAPPTSIVLNQGRSSKTKLNMLNPMSLLSRRRSAQVVGKPIGQASSHRTSISVATTGLPDDYDPRIRGKVVHDFSAPRPSRYLSANELSLPTGGEEYAIFKDDSRSKPNLENVDEGSASVNHPIPVFTTSKSPDRQHTPIFKEHFGEDIDWRYDSAAQINRPRSSTAKESPIPESSGKRSPLPAFARNLPSDITNDFLLKELTSPPRRKALNNAPSPRSPPTTPSTVTLPPTTSDTSLCTPPLKERSSASSNADVPKSLTLLPKHMTSNSSRFSFDLAGVGSAAQEKLLEDKHRLKNARKKRESAVSGTSTGNREPGMLEEDDSNYDDMDFDEELEEKIPGVNVDDDEDNDFSFLDSPRNPVLNTSDDLAGGPQLPDRSAGLICLHEVRSTEDSPTNLEPPLQLRVVPSQPESQVSLTEDRINDPWSLNHLHEDEDRVTSCQVMPIASGHISSKSFGTFDKDELYFDDGLIDDLDIENGSTFDESIFDESMFDDENSRIYGLPLRDLKPLPAVLESSSPEASQQSTRPISLDSDGVPVVFRAEGDQDSNGPSLFSFDKSFLPRKSSLTQKSRQPQLKVNRGAELTHDNLEAYHSALAVAANRAALDGKFDRRTNTDDGTDREQPVEESSPRIVSFDENQRHMSDEKPASRIAPEEDDDYNSDNDLDDDAIIAAANAEALENDDEGFYGQEFGFFAHSNGVGEAQYANGGYFGSPVDDGIKRSHSGRANGQEPSLTPITERSEWSQRNSMISLALYGGHAPSVPTPGLAQLADAIQFEDDHMSLSALMKLRRGAWGGSNASLQSSSGSQNSGPQMNGTRPITPNNMLGIGLSGSNLAGSSFSLSSSNDAVSDEDIIQGSPTLTLQTQGLAMAPPGLDAPKSGGSDSSPKRRNAIRTYGHSRNSSGAESVSYVKELNEDGIKTWVLERRRTAEGGQMEVLGRQIVEGGRI